MVLNLVKVCNDNAYLRWHNHFQNHDIIFWHFDHGLQREYVNAYRVLHNEELTPESKRAIEKRCLYLRRQLAFRDKYQDVQNKSAVVRWCRTQFEGVERALQGFYDERQYTRLLDEYTQAEGYLDRAVSDYLREKQTFMDSLNQEERIWYQQFWKEECW